MTQQYREVKRKAVVGDQIKVTSPLAGWYKPGDVGTVTGVYLSEALTRLPHGAWYVNHHHYVVLEPFETATPADPLTALTDALAANAVRITSLETELGAIKRELADIRGQAAAAVKERLGALERNVADHERTIGEMGGYGGGDVERQVARERLRKREKTRDEIVAMAKADVETLLKSPVGNVPICHSPGSRAGYDPNDTDRVEFVVNREKRTVVALIYSHAWGKSLWARGKSRCAPDDVFNTHIGKALSIRRALGLPVPYEYMDVPVPTEPSRGDLVKATAECIEGNMYVIDRKAKATELSVSIVDGAYWLTTGTWLNRDDFEIVDDSRDHAEVGA